MTDGINLPPLDDGPAPLAVYDAVMTGVDRNNAVSLGSPISALTWTSCIAERSGGWFSPCGKRGKLWE